MVVIREAMDPAVYGKSMVLKLTGYMTLAALPKIYTNEEKSSIRKRNIAIVVALLIGIFIILGLIHIFHTPLDILYYRLLRKF